MLKMTSGLQHLENWAEGAGQTHKNQLYKALFAITDGTAASNYGIIHDKENPNAHFVLVREDLVVKVDYPDNESFGITYVGALVGAPGLGLALEAAL